MSFLDYKCVWVEGKVTERHWLPNQGVGDKVPICAEGI